MGNIPFTAVAVGTQSHNFSTPQIDVLSIRLQMAVFSLFYLHNFNI